PIFDLVQKSAPEVGGELTDEEMLKTFNMGWGFAVIVDKTEVDDTIDTIEKNGVEAAQIGTITNTASIVARYKNKKFLLR
ncbi:MAG: AIR synthase-related protein, partial [Candidatus Bathyarchaeota archaeon]|nr:AIR synthase-related protein [Candidatus Bathyarchaeota archaeon]